MISSKTKIGLLLAAHVVGGLLLAWTAEPATTAFPIAQFGLCALVFAEAGMLGMWGGLSAMRLVFRLLAVLLAILYLWAGIVVAVPGEDHVFVLLIALTAVAILVVLVVLRHSRRRLRLAHLANESPVSEGFQFSIRHLLLATALVAVVLGIGRGVRTITDAQWENILAVATFPPCFIMVELASLWAALGIGRPFPRLAVVVPIAFVVGAIPAFYLPGPTARESWLFFLWPTVVAIQAIITAASLLVVRSCGWRLVRGDSGRADEHRDASDSLSKPPGS